MEVRLRVTHRQSVDRPREVRLTLSEAGIDIGRALTSDLCLEDAEWVVSGLHARIQACEGGIWLTDLSRNGTYLNGAPDPLPARRPVELRDGDRLGIGPYEVMVWFGSAPVASVVEPRSGRLDVTLVSEANLRHRSDTQTDVPSLPNPGAESTDESETRILSRFDPEPGLELESKTEILNPFDASRTEILDRFETGQEAIEEDATAVWPRPELETQIVPGPVAATEQVTQIIQGPEIAGDPGTATSVRDTALAEAMDAGFQAARRALLAHFEPAALERRFLGASGLDRALTLEHKARCWEGFGETYERLAAETTEDLVRRFGDAFSHVYLERIEHPDTAHSQDGTT